MISPTSGISCPLSLGDAALLKRVGYDYYILANFQIFEQKDYKSFACFL
jgi:hypothetical protein